MFTNYTSLLLPCVDEDHIWNPDNSTEILNLHREIYTMDFVSLDMLNPFIGLNLCLYTLILTLLGIAIVCLYLNWPSPVTKQQPSPAIMSLSPMTEEQVLQQSSWIPSFWLTRTISITSLSPMVEERVSQQSSWIPSFWLTRKRHTISVDNENFDYECFDCTFKSSSRNEINLHSRYCVLGVNRLQFSDIE